jgi:hypothetical protein
MREGRLDRRQIPTEMGRDAAEFAHGARFRQLEPAV